MTWVIGATTIFGYGALISDVEVTFADGTRAPLVQKAFPITNFIGAGFAGSVQIGYALLDELSQLTATSGPLRDNEGWKPKFVANAFYPKAAQLFAKFPKSEQALLSHILLVGAAPDEESALGARVYLIRLVSPYFIPGVMGAAIKVCSIGNGSSSKDLKRMIKPLVRLDSGILQSEVGRPGGWGEMFSFSVTIALRDYPIAGVSEHHHLISVHRGHISVSNNDLNTHAPDGSVRELRMPKVAQSYQEFLTMCSSRGHGHALASC
jgi:hypothetical protein